MAKRIARREPRMQADEVRQAQASDDRSSVATMDQEPNPDQIARRAYELYCERGYLEGRAMDDWLQAEEELRRHRSKGSDA